MDDELLLLRDLSSKLPYKPSYRSLFRWATEGMKRGDKVIKLQTVSLPSGLASSKALYDEFIRKLGRARK